MPLLKDFNQIGLFLTPRKSFNLYISEVYSELSQISKMEFFQKIVNS